MKNALLPFTLAAFLSLWVPLVPLQAQQVPVPVLRLDFSDGSNAMGALGQKIPARVEGEFSVQDSPHGKAMLSGPGAGYLHFPAYDIINPRSGTVEMWISPQDWDGTEEQYHVFFDARGQGVLYLYKYYKGNLLMLSATANGGPYFFASAGIKSWKSGQWHFLVGTWSPSRNSLYVDGKLINTASAPALPTSISGEFEIGDDPWTSPVSPRTSQTLVADVRIYDHALSAEHIAAHYAGDYNKVVPLSAETLSLSLSHDIKNRQLNVTLDTGGADFDIAEAEISLKQSGLIVQEAPPQQIKDNTAQVSFATAQLARGSYQIVADVTAGTQSAQVTQEFIVPDLPVFTLDFSDGSNAINVQGQKIRARVEGQFQVQDSPHGKAMLSGPGAGYLHFPVKDKYPAQDLINPQSGTVEMWVSPQDWDGTEEQYHVFFDARGQGVLYLYKYYKGNLLMLSAAASGGPYFFASAVIKPWKSGQWHFLAGTWSSAQNSLYVDGELTNTVLAPALPSSISGEFEIGDDPWTSPVEPRTSQTLVADVRIYHQALSARHIAAHFAGDYNFAIPLSSEVLSLKLSHDVEAHQLQVTLNTGGADVSGARADISLQQNGIVIQRAPSQQIENHTAEVSFATDQLAPGDYQVVADVTAGTEQEQITRAFVVPDLSWMGNELGEEDVVLPPWTPMQVENSAGGVDVLCWGRTYQFHNGPLPTQIISQAQAMLARPITLKVLSGGQELSWQNGKIKVLESSPTHVVLEGSADTLTSAGRLFLTTSIRLEYDGLATLSLHLQKPTAWQPDAVSLEIPVKQEKALYYHRASATANSPNGLVPAGNGVVDQTAFQPFSWLGDDTRGLFWFCETAQFWPNWSADHALQIVRNPDSVSIEVNLLNGQELPEDWTYHCGLQATPVKAIPPDWRKWRFAPAQGAKVKIMWPTPTEDSLKYYGYPEAANEVAYAAAVKGVHDAGRAAVTYSGLAFLSSASPEYRWFEKQWDLGIHDDHSADVVRFNASFNAVSPKQENLQDFLIWKNLQFMSQFHLDGYYHDNSSARASTFADAGYGWQDGNTRRPTYGILAMRRLYRRLYAVAKTEDPQAFLMAHMSGKVTIPFLGYEDAMLNGEHFRGQVKDSYMDVMPLDQWRAVYTGRQWGVMGYFLPEFDAKYSALVTPTRGLAALVMLHDVAVWPIMSKREVWDTMYDALDKFGYIESTFIPYWSPQPPASTEMNDVYISAYKRDDGRALLIVGNTSRQPRSGQVTLNAEALGLPIGEVFSWPDGAPQQVQNGEVQVSMAGLDYRLLLVGNPPVQ